MIGEADGNASVIFSKLLLPPSKTKVGVRFQDTIDTKNNWII